MAMMMSSLYDAPVKSGATDELARKAAEEVASYDNKVARIESDLSLLNGMVGFNMTLTAGVLVKLLAAS